MGYLPDVRNKLADFKAVTNIQREIIEKPVAPVVNTWYTSGSVDLNVMVSNPSGMEQKVPVKVYLPKEAKMEHIIENSGLDIQYDVQLDTLYAVGEFQLGAGESLKKFIKMRDIWQVAEEDVVLLRSQSENLFKQLEKTQFSAQALVLKNDIETRADKILRTQKENTATPQDKIMTFRENKESLAAAYKSLDEIKSLTTQAAASKSFLGSFGSMQTVTIWGIIIAFVTGFGLLIVILFSMWKHQMQLAGRQLALQARVLGGKKLTKGELAQLLTGNMSPRTVSQVSKKLTAAERKKLKQYMDEKSKKLRVKEVAVSFPAFVIGKIRQSGRGFKVLIGIALFLLVILGAYFLLRGFNKEKQEMQLQTSVATGQPESALVANDNAINEATDSQEEIDLATLLSFAEQDLGQAVESDSNEIDGQAESNEQTSAQTSQPETEDDFVIIKNTPTGWLNVRQNPSTSSEIITKVNSGEKFIVLASTIAKSGSSGWHQIELTDKRSGWVSAEYAEIVVE